MRSYTYFLIVQPTDKPNSVQVQTIVSSNIQDTIHKVNEDGKFSLLGFFKEDLVEGKNEEYAYGISTSLLEARLKENEDFLNTDWEAECVSDLIPELEVELIESSLVVD